MGMHCQPETDNSGTRNPEWGSVPNAQLFAPERGWCNARGEPAFRCACLPYEQFNHSATAACAWIDNDASVCVNQCTGHGRCLLGFCLCQDGWCAASLTCQHRPCSSWLAPCTGAQVPRRLITSAKRCRDSPAPSPVVWFADQSANIGLQNTGAAVVGAGTARTAPAQLRVLRPTQSRLPPRSGSRTSRRRLRLRQHGP